LTEGGRIWWISREARRLMGQLTNARYNSIVAIIYVPLLQSTATTAIYCGEEVSNQVYFLQLVWWPMSLLCGRSTPMPMALSLLILDRSRY
ncbi:hypothetical protein L218DRAFT_1016407, partial [Marasmius fiardii PR-910]